MLQPISFDKDSIASTFRMSIINFKNHICDQEWGKYINLFANGKYFYVLQYIKIYQKFYMFLLIDHILCFPQLLIVSMAVSFSISYTFFCYLCFLILYNVRTKVWQKKVQWATFEWHIFYSFQLHFASRRQI